MAVGGLKHDLPTEQVYVYNKQLKEWKENKIPPMSTAKYGIGDLSLQSALLVVGGNIRKRNDPVNNFNLFVASHIMHSEHRSCTVLDIVQIFKSDTPQWYTTNPLPKALYCP